MRAPFIAASGTAPVLSKLMAASLIALALAGCKHGDEPGGHVAGWTLVDASQRHPIMVSQRPTSTSVRVVRGSHGLSPAQKAHVADFLGHFRATDQGNSRLVITVPSGSPNESEAVRAVQDLRHVISSYGFPESSVAIEPYPGGRDANAPIRLSYLRFIAEGPDCGRWPTNLAEDYRNLPYPNFGCAQQHNLAAQVANPADLLGPRTMDPTDAERRYVVTTKYRKGTSTVSEKAADEKVQVKSQ
jgi:pilus assembly protein CpaD